MGLFDFLGGSSSTEVEVPSWIEGPAKEMLNRSVDMAKMPYLNWQGPNVAALDDGAMRGRAAMRGAFGMDSSVPYMPQAQEFAGGIRGYSAAPLYDANMATLRERYPGAMEYHDSFFIDPVTGLPGSRMNQNQQPLYGPQVPPMTIQEKFSAWLEGGNRENPNNPGMLQMWGQM